MYEEEGEGEGEVEIEIEIVEILLTTYEKAVSHWEARAVELKGGGRGE